MPNAILLFAHGARDAAWALPFQRTRERLAQTCGEDTQVGLAFLEFMSPTLIEAGQALVEQGCTQVTVVPLFLGAGGHVRKDLPLLMQRLQAEHPDVMWTLTQAAGETDTVVNALADAARLLARRSAEQAAQQPAQDGS